MIYLATPIKHTDPVIEAWRVSVATRAAATLHDAGIPVFSPATHGSGFAHLSSIRQGWDYWSRIDLPILLNCCSVLAVLNLDGWKESQGVTAEIQEAEATEGAILGGIKIVHIRWCSACDIPLKDHRPGGVCECYPSILSSVRCLFED